VLLGHSAALREVWAAAMGLAASLAGCRPTGGPLAAAAARLYAVMFAATGSAEEALQRMVGRDGRAGWNEAGGLLVLRDPGPEGGGA
jgi:hypothetical protein